METITYREVCAIIAEKFGIHRYRAGVLVQTLAYELEEKGKVYSAKMGEEIVTLVSYDLEKELAA